MWRAIRICYLFLKFKNKSGGGPPPPPIPRDDGTRRINNNHDPDYEVIEFGQQYTNAPPLPQKNGNGK